MKIRAYKDFQKWQGLFIKEKAIGKIIIHFQRAIGHEERKLRVYTLFMAFLYGAQEEEDFGC